MAKDDRQEKAQRRARDDLEKGVRRNDVQLAVDALTRLAGEERAEQLPAVARVFIGAVQRAHRARDWQTLSQLAARAQQEAGLVGSVPEEQARDDAWWSLAWGCLRAGPASRAGPCIEKLAPRLEGRAAGLLVALRALSDGATALPTSALQDVPLPDEDPRLGNEPVQAASRAELGAPREAAEAEGAVIAASAAQGFRSFATTVNAWLLDPAVRADVARTAGQLAAREVLLRLSRNEQALAEPALLLRSAAAHADLKADQLSALRAVLAGRAGSQPVDSADTVRAIGALALPLLADGELGSLLLPAIERLAVANDALPAFEPVLEAACEGRAEFGLASKLLRVSGRVHPDRMEAPPPVARAMQRALEGQPALKAWLAAADKERVTETMAVGVDWLSPQLAERLLEALWAASTPTSRSMLAAYFRKLLTRVKTDTLAPPRGWRSLAQREAFQLVMDAVDQGDAAEEVLEEFEDQLAPRELLEVVDLILKERSDSSRLGGSARALWDRWKDRMVPLSLSMLRLALVEAADAKEAQAAAELHLEGRRSVAPFLAVIAEAGLCGHVDVAEALVDRSLTTFASDVAALCELFGRLRLAAPLSVARRMASALTAAAEHPAAPLTAEQKRIVALARRMAPRPRRRAEKSAAAKPKTPRKKSTAKTPAKKRGAGKQPSLF